MTDWDDQPGPRPPGDAEPGAGSGPVASNPPGSPTPAASSTSPAAPASPRVIPPVRSTPPWGAPPGASGWSAGAEPPTPPPQVPAPVARRASGRGWLVVAALIVALALVAAGYLVGQAERNDQASGSSGLTTTSTSPGGSTTPVVPSAGDQPVVAVAAALSPAVVQIQTSDGLGSGIVYDASGLIVTNAHVVGTASTVQVALSTGQTLSGHVVGADPSSDIAVVRVTPGSTKLTAAKLADAEPAVGAVTVAIGSPFGLSGTVTSGVVSAVDRPLDNEADVAVNMIQTDAAINPGNSGGALADINGEVIGVNAEILSQSGDNNGIGFAIPIRTAMAVAAKITRGGSLAKPVVGVQVRNDPTGASGAYVVTVNAGSPAAKAGLRQGDRIVAIDGTTVATSGDFVDEVIVHSPGQTATLKVVRGGSTLTVQVTFAAG